MPLLHLLQLPVLGLLRQPQLFLLLELLSELLVLDGHVLLEGSWLDGLELANAGEQARGVVPEQTYW